MKPLIIYHANCADGFGAAFAAWNKFGNEAEYVPMQYDRIKTEEDAKKLLPDMTERDVYILDFSFPAPVMTYIINVAGYLTWLDHHKTAFEMWAPPNQQSYFFEESNEAHIVLDNSKSGALIAWEHFMQNNKYPQMLIHIDDYDRWQFRYADTKPFNKALWALQPWSFEQWNELEQETSSPRNTYYIAFIAQGDALLRDHEARVKKHVEKSRMANINGHKGLVINAPGYVTSDAGHELAVQSKTFGMTYTIDENLQVRCSLRSEGEYDVTCLAKVYGGGGHKNAAGFTCSIEQLTEILQP